MPINTSITLRESLSRPLTWVEGDNNFKQLVANDQALQDEKQNVSPKLSAIAASVWAANMLLMTTGAETLEMFETGILGRQLMQAVTDNDGRIALSLENVNNTSDMDKPVSTATQAALNALEQSIADGYQPLSDKLSAIVALAWSVGHVPYFGENDTVLTSSSSEFGRTLWSLENAMALASAAGLGNVDNTSDIDKPISTATQTALDDKQDEHVNLAKFSQITVTDDTFAWLALASRQAQAEALNAVTRTPESTGAVLTPTGTEAERPAVPVEGMFRFNSDTHRFEGYQDGEWRPIGGGATLPLFAVLWWPGSRAHIPAGFVAYDGQTLSRATWPDAWADIADGKQPSVSDADWVADPLKRASFSTGDGSTTFRVPDLNGKYAGSHGAVFLRGDGLNSAGSPGLIQRDALQQIEGKFYERRMNDGTNNVHTDANSGAFALAVANGPSMTRSSATVGAALSADAVYFNASLVARTASETRPLNATGCYIVKLADEAINAAGVDVVQLASDVANMKLALQRAYNPDNIVGTVSQAGGVPTGAIIERGSNANGQYTKYADGTLICSFVISSGIQNVSVAAGALYTSGQLTWTFPQEFVGDVPSVSGIAGRTSTDAGKIFFSAYTRSTTAFVYYFVGTTSSPTMGVFGSLMAIGRWF